MLQTLSLTGHVRCCYDHGHIRPICTSCFTGYISKICYSIILGMDAACFHWSSSDDDDQHDKKHCTTRKIRKAKQAAVSKQATLSREQITWQPDSEVLADLLAKAVPRHFISCWCLLAIQSGYLRPKWKEASMTDEIAKQCKLMRRVKEIPPFSLYSLVNPSAASMLLVVSNLCQSVDDLFVGRARLHTSEVKSHGDALEYLLDDKLTEAWKAYLEELEFRSTCSDHGKLWYCDSVKLLLDLRAAADALFAFDMEFLKLKALVSTTKGVLRINFKKLRNNIGRRIYLLREFLPRLESAQSQSLVVECLKTSDVTVVTESNDYPNAPENHSRTSTRSPGQSHADDDTDRISQASTECDRSGAQPLAKTVDFSCSTTHVVHRTFSAVPGFSENLKPMVDIDDTADWSMSEYATSESDAGDGSGTLPDRGCFHFGRCVIVCILTCFALMTLRLAEEVQWSTFSPPYLGGLDVIDEPDFKQGYVPSSGWMNSSALIHEITFTHTVAQMSTPAMGAWDYSSIVLNSALVRDRSSEVCKADER